MVAATFNSWEKGCTTSSLLLSRFCVTGLPVMIGSSNRELHVVITYLGCCRFVFRVQTWRDRLMLICAPVWWSVTAETVYLQGTRAALYSNDRESISVTVQEVTPRAVGALVALYERAVGIYASLVNINAYHQPGTLLRMRYFAQAP
jgi:glucose-6-phosphate isomerase